MKLEGSSMVVNFKILTTILTQSIFDSNVFINLEVGKTLTPAHFDIIMVSGLTTVEPLYSGHPL